MCKENGKIIKWEDVFSVNTNIHFGNFILNVQFQLNWTDWSSSKAPS